MAKEKKTVKQICKCENCGNEAEMVVTCSLVEETDAAHAHSTPGHKKVKGTGTCTSCGNEAEMWVDI